MRLTEWCAFRSSTTSDHEEFDAFVSRPFDVSASKTTLDLFGCHVFPHTCTHASLTLPCFLMQTLADPVFYSDMSPRDMFEFPGFDAIFEAQVADVPHDDSLELALDRFLMDTEPAWPTHTHAPPPRRHSCPDAMASAAATMVAHRGLSSSVSSSALTYKPSRNKLLKSKPLSPPQRSKCDCCASST